MPQSNVTAIGFDLGDTLTEYEGLPLSWVDHYGEALRRLATHLGVSASDAQVAAGSDVLRRFNTRLNPRDHEVPFRTVLDELTAVFRAVPAVDESRAARAFFAVFRQRLRAFPDAKPALEKLRARGVHIGCFTDVPYGMPNELVTEDVAIAELTDVIDVLITSCDAGSRKPRPETLRTLAAALGAEATTFVYVGNEKKDIEAAQAFGCRSVLLDRTGANPTWGQTHTIRTLGNLQQELDLR